MLFARAWLSTVTRWTDPDGPKNLRMSTYLDLVRAPLDLRGGL